MTPRTIPTLFSRHMFKIFPYLQRSVAFRTNSPTLFLLCVIFERFNLHISAVVLMFSLNFKTKTDVLQCGKSRDYLGNNRGAVVRPNVDLRNQEIWHLFRYRVSRRDLRRSLSGKYLKIWRDGQVSEANQLKYLELSSNSGYTGSPRQLCYFKWAFLDFMENFRVAL